MAEQPGGRIWLWRRPHHTPRPSASTSWTPPMVGPHSVRTRWEKSSRRWTVDAPGLSSIPRRRKSFVSAGPDSLAYGGNHGARLGQHDDAIVEARRSSLLRNSYRRRPRSTGHAWRGIFTDIGEATAAELACKGAGATYLLPTTRARARSSHGSSRGARVAARAGRDCACWRAVVGTRRAILDLPTGA